jgi:hypothetical protein
MAERGDVFLREVDEEVRREQLYKLWERYGLYFVAVALMILVGIGGTKWWQYRQTSVAEAAGERYDAAARLASTGKAEDVAKAFSGIIGDAPTGYAVLARLRVAGGLAVAGKPAEALVHYDGLAKDASVDQMLRDYAAVQAAMLRVDSADWSEMETRLAPLVGGSSPWRHMAREVQALAAIKAGKTDDARKHLEALLGERSLPPSMLERVQLLLTVLTDQAAKPTPAPSAAPSAPATQPVVPTADTAKTPTPAPKK